MNFKKTLTLLCITICGFTAQAEDPTTQINELLSTTEDCRKTEHHEIATDNLLRYFMTGRTGGNNVGDMVNHMNPAAYCMVEKEPKFEPCTHQIRNYMIGTLMAIASDIQNEEDKAAGLEQVADTRQELRACVEELSQDNN